MQWLKELFIKKKTKQEITNWLEQQLVDWQTMHESLANTLKEQFPQHIENVRAALKELDNAQLQNQNIQERAKHLMLGNRQQLIKDTTRLLDNLEFPQEQDDIQDIKARLATYVGQTKRATTILMDYLRNNIKKLSQTLATIEKNINEYALSFQLKEELETIKKQLDTINNAENQITKINEEQQTDQQKIQELQTKKPELDNEQEGLKNSTAYKVVHDEIQKAHNKRKTAEQEILRLLEPLKEVLKEYAQKKQQNKLTTYGEDPIKALTEDYNLRVLDYISPVRRAIEDAEILIGNPEEIYDALNKLTKETLGLALTNYGIAKKQEADTHKRITQTPIMQHLMEVKEKIKKLDQELTEIQEKQYEQIDIEQEINKLNELLKKHKIKLT